MKTISETMRAFWETHPFDSDSDDCATVLDQLYLAYANCHESDPPEIREGFKEPEEFLHTLPLADNNTVCDLCCHLCTATNIKPSSMVCGLLPPTVARRAANHKYR